MSISQSTPNSWTWTVIQIQGVQSVYEPQYNHLHRSPEGQLLMDKSLVGKRFIIWGEDVQRGFSAEPPSRYIKEARSFTQVQIGPKHYTAAHLLPNGEPQLTPEFANTHKAVQNADHSWCFVPKQEAKEAKREEHQPEQKASNPNNAGTEAQSGNTNSGNSGDHGNFGNSPGVTIFSLHLI